MRQERTSINNGYNYELPDRPAEARKQRIGGKVMSWLARADPHDLRDFCVANAENHQRQLAGLAQLQPQLQEDMQRRARRLRESGILPEQHRQVYEWAFGTVVPFQVLDFFEAGGMRANGRYCLGSFAVQLAPQFRPGSGYQAATPELFGTHFHELHHVVGDMRSGFIKPDEDHLWLEEICAAHVTQVSEADAYDPSVLDPGGRIDTYPERYESLRELLAVISEHARRPIPVEMMTGVYYRLRGTAPKARAQFFDRVNAGIRQLVPGYENSGLATFSAGYAAMARRKQTESWVAERLSGVYERLGISDRIVLDDIPQDSGGIRVVRVPES
jgi:hypothetical protein